ncbi:STAS domain-containing protein [Arthrobacter sp. ISL-30]|uniref:STAS domain-containing protein n=1 Tax=Arthrobacter sp. ISL-30 TaxID=2819109 RepID=UPI001BE98F3D|nr:STAS domain-containing protein [Arthrobacter sp. ISL-30]MBT2513143.1 STAS domain-containing protein [Arthrobacter sp. ISL-30]
MKFDVELSGEDSAVIRANGRLNLMSAPDLKHLVTGIVQGDGRPNVVVDLAEIDFVDSTGLGALVFGLKTARAAGGDLRIARPGKQIKMVLQLTSLDRILEPHDTVEECFE